MPTPTPAAVSPRPAPAAPPTAVRSDIQGLRAVAVLVVLVYHFWPGGLTGGYVGVDVFFVISGFLISSHLLTRPPSGPKDLAVFWARRVRRLLPAASVVLLATLLASLAWMPSSLLPGVAREIGASALSVENWALAGSATDYLAAENAPSPVQHYWSLSVEEQFYVLWPVLIAVLGLVGRRRPLLWRASGLVVVTAASFVASVVLTSADPAGAYFVTHTRIWELGLGSLLAVAAHRGWRMRAALPRAVAGWLGLAMVATATVLFSGATDFPGYAALLPTVGAVLVIAAAGDDVPGSPRLLLSRRPAQVLGDISYSVYLWHWPVVVIAPYALGRDLTWVEKLAAVAAVVLAAALTKRFVEDPARRSPRLVGSLRLSFALAAASAVLFAGVGVGVVVRADEARAAEARSLAGAIGDDCVGAAALRQGCTPVEGDRLLSSPASAAADRSRLYADDCWSNRPYTRHRVCSYGPEGADLRVALLGNSHAGHWEPALSPEVLGRGGRLDTYLVSECYPVDVPLDFGPGTDRLTTTCGQWTDWALAAVARGGYDVVVLSNRTFRPPRDVPEDQRQQVLEAAYARTLERLTDAGVRVVVVRDVPSAVDNGPDCVAQHEDDPAACANPRAEALEPDPLAVAAGRDTSQDVTLLDPTDRFCDAERCHVVVGGLIAYFDHGHMTTSFARTLRPEVAAALDRALG